VTDGRTVRRSDGQTDGQTESIIANTALCIARAMLTRCKNAATVYHIFIFISISFYCLLVTLH